MNDQTQQTAATTTCAASRAEGANLTAVLDGKALAEAAKKLRRLRLTDVGGRGEMPCATVKSALQKGLGGLYDDEAVTYILRHGLKYYLAALPANARHKPRGEATSA